MKIVMMFEVSDRVLEDIRRSYGNTGKATEVEVRREILHLWDRHVAAQLPTSAALTPRPPGELVDAVHDRAH